MATSGGRCRLRHPLAAVQNPVHLSLRSNTTRTIVDGARGTGEQGIWQRRYWEHTLRDAEDFVRHVEYIHYNPVKHGYAQAAADWPYSSFHRYVRAGEYPVDWAGVPGEFDEVGHE